MRTAGVITLLFIAGCGQSPDKPVGQENSTGKSSANPAATNAPPTSPQPPTPSPPPPVTANLVDHADIAGAKRSDRDGVLAAELRQGDQIGDWASEAFHEQIKPRLKALGKLIAHPEQLDDEHLKDVIAADFASEPLRPADLTAVYQAPAATVLRSQKAAQGGKTAAEPKHKSLAGAKATLLEMISPLDPHGAIEINFKTFRVFVNGNTGTSISYLDYDGPARSGSANGGSTDAKSAKSSGARVQTNVTWHCSWKRADEKAPWQIASIALEDFEEVAYRGGKTGRLFADCTAAAFAQEPTFKSHLLYSTNHWRSRLGTTLGVELAGHHGMAVGDVNGDGLDDLYYCETGGLPNRLLLQQPDGTLRDASKECGLDWLDRTRAALLCDFDNDGDPDLVMAWTGKLAFLENDGAGKFRLVKIQKVPPHPYSLTALDYDQDGDLDVYTSDYGNDFEQFGDTLAPLPWQDANNGAPNVMLRNDGGWNFVDVTKQVGLDHNNTKYSFAASWDDYDNDGDLDLYVANDFGRNNLYRNDGGKFLDVAAASGVDDVSPGMSACFADYNNDGLMDIFVGNMFSGAGNRITTQERFKPDVGQEVLGEYRRFARGNALFKNLGNGKFQDVSIESGTTLGRWAWTSMLFDINNDGWQDMFVVNGYVTGENADDL